ncbi:hypothetical protein BHE74_00034102 [Ensete ventricosum]|nr:hypothetical protein BHE74_00034102 [Ensete ventricosum]RZS01238.1 hypothetical protein BHM03_00031085 [Ensete ventricosum]
MSCSRRELSSSLRLREVWRVPAFVAVDVQYYSWLGLVRKRLRSNDSSVLVPTHPHVNVPRPIEATFAGATPRESAYGGWCSAVPEAHDPRRERIPRIRIRPLRPSPTREWCGSNRND